MLVDASLTMNSNMPVVVKKANSILHCIAGRLREVILLPCAALVRLYLERSAQFWVPQYERRRYTGASLVRATEVMVGLQYLTYKDGLRAETIQPGEGLGASHQFV